MSTELTSTVWGIAPWSGELLQVSGDVDRGRANKWDYFSQLTDDFETYFNALREAGIDYCADWSGGRRDYFRATVLNAEGFQDGIHDAPVTRWFNTNTFFRQPTIDGPLSNKLQGIPDHGLLTVFTDGSGPPRTYQPTLLSPYAFARLSARGQGVSEAQADTYVAGLYDELLANIGSQGITHVLFHEPFAPYNEVEESERRRLGHAVGTLAANHPEVEVGVYFSYGDGAEFVRELGEDDRIAAVGCDLQRTPAASLAPLPGHRFLAGVVDGANTLTPDDKDLLPLLESAVEAVGAPEVSVTHTVDLEHVPLRFALEKVAQIGRLGSIHERTEAVT
ncbi:MAG TPA: hypothetical protein VN554_01930 [Verrucomicrobiae bacterium]|nr:hypothetical protein [Verrucomicrobiae bacterium]